MPLDGMESKHIVLDVWAQLKECYKLEYIVKEFMLTCICK